MQNTDQAIDSCHFVVGTCDAVQTTKRWGNTAANCITGDIIATKQPTIATVAAATLATATVAAATSATASAVATDNDNDYSKRLVTRLEF